MNRVLKKRFIVRVGFDPYFGLEDRVSSRYAVQHTAAELRLMPIEMIGVALGMILDDTSNGTIYATVPRL